MNSQALLTRARALGANFTPGQLISLALSFVLVVAVVGGSALWLNTPSYSLLFADMDEESASQVVTRLRSMKVDYQLDQGGRAIRVPSNRVDELRLELTAQGLPSSGRIGFEIFDRTAFGATEFVEQINYRRALEGEIARTIGTIGEVEGARVHIAMGKDSLFGEKRPAKASVVLKLRDQRRTLPASTVSGISNLVAASVEGLKPDSVVILDSLGRPLSQLTDGDEAVGAAQLERQQRLERDMSTRVIALLEPVVGEGRVRVNVALALNPRSRELTEERWDPNAVVRSRQTSADTSTLAPLPGGVAGTRGNLPTPPPSSVPPATAAATPPAAPGATGPGSSRQTETTNYEVSRTTTRTIEPPGDVARVSVAVILDDAQEVKTDAEGKQTVTRVPRKPEELQKLQALVAASVGMNDTRGDQVTVENVSFDSPLTTEPEAPGFWSRYGSAILDGARTVAILVVCVIALLFVVRPMVTRASTPTVRTLPVSAGMVTAGDRPRTVAELEQEFGATGGDRREAAIPSGARRVAGIAQREPEQAARLIRGLMTEQGR